MISRDDRGGQCKEGQVYIGNTKHNDSQRGYDN